MARTPRTTDPATSVLTGERVPYARRRQAVAPTGIHCDIPKPSAQAVSRFDSGGERYHCGRNRGAEKGGPAAVALIAMSSKNAKTQESAGNSRQRRLDGQLVEPDSSCGALTCTDAENQRVIAASTVYQKRLHPEPCGNCWGDADLGALREREQSFVLISGSNSVHKTENADVGGSE